MTTSMTTAQCKRAQVPWQLHWLLPRPHKILQNFCWALRHWAGKAPAAREAAQRYDPGATGFSLSDTGLQLVKQLRTSGVHACKQAGQHLLYDNANSHHRSGMRLRCEIAEGGTTELGQAVPCPDEAAIFRELRLGYVPPLMREL